MYFIDWNTVFFPPGLRVIRDFDPTTGLHVLGSHRQVRLSGGWRIQDSSLINWANLSICVWNIDSTETRRICLLQYYCILSKIPPWLSVQASCDSFPAQIIPSIRRSKGHAFPTTERINSSALTLINSFTNLRGIKSKALGGRVRKIKVRIAFSAREVQHNRFYLKGSWSDSFAYPFGCPAGDLCTWQGDW